MRATRAAKFACSLVVYSLKLQCLSLMATTNVEAGSTLILMRRECYFLASDPNVDFAVNFVNRSLEVCMHDADFAQ